MAARASSGQYDVTAVAFLDEGILQAHSRSLLLSTIAVAAVFFGAAIFLIVIFSDIVTRPLHRLRNVMERTNLENYREQVDIKTSDDEIEALVCSYQRMIERLQEAMDREKRNSLLQLQAQFDTLQAQINPHFIYNVLNIISARGMSDDDESICEMCGSLAAMLRYSTNNQERYARIGEELVYLKQYFYLLKARYGEKLSFAVEVEDKVQAQIIPKMTLQQVVENSITHGFADSFERMHISIRGEMTGETGWRLVIRDNGAGFPPEKLAQVREQIARVRGDILHNANSIELKIGGMGLINVYARLFILYKDTLFFEIESAPQGEHGAVATIGVKE